MMKKSSFFALSAISLALAGCGGSDDVQNQEGSVTLSGVAALGEVLTATPSDPNGIDESTLVFTWFADGNIIDGETGSTYTIPAAGGGTGDIIQNDTQISAAVVYTDNDGFTEGHNTGLSAEIGVEAAGTIEVTGVAQAGETLTAVLTDDNGITDGNVAYSWQADGVDIAGETASTLLLTNDQTNAVITVTVTYTDDDGFVATLVSAPTSAVIGEGVNTPAEFSGLTATISNDFDSLTGTVTVTDVNEGEALLVAITDQAVSFGVFSIDENGAWTYVLDTTDPTVSGLASSADTLTVTVPLESVDGTVASFVITIQGLDVDNTQAAFIRDTDSGDTGELRYQIFDSADAEGLLQGRVEVDFTRLDDDVTANASADAFITLFNGDTNNAGAILDLRIRDNSFGVRNPSFDIDSARVVPSLTDYQTAVITWEYPNGDGTLAPEVTIEIDGVSATDAPFTPDNSPFGGVTHVSFRFGDNGGTRDPETYFSVDNVRIYNDTAGTSPIFSDNFETYAVGEDLDPDNNANSVYNSATSEAVTESLTGETGGGDDGVIAPGTPGNQFAQINDTDSGDTGELRYLINSDPDATEGLLEGRIDVTFTRFDDDLGDGDAFITLFNSATNNDGAILDLRVRDNSFGVRSPSFDVDQALAVPNLTGFQTAVITWEYPGGDSNVNPEVTLTIDGVSVTDAPFTPVNNSIGGVTHVAFRFGDNGRVIPAEAFLSIDNIVIYSDVEGTNEIFSDDFQSYADGTDLDPDANADSVYNGATSEAVVATEQ